MNIRRYASECFTRGKARCCPGGFSTAAESLQPTDGQRSRAHKPPGDLTPAALAPTSALCTAFARFEVQRTWALLSRFSPLHQPSVVKA